MIQQPPPAQSPEARAQAQAAEAPRAVQEQVEAGSLEAPLPRPAAAAEEEPGTLIEALVDLRDLRVILAEAQATNSALQAALQETRNRLAVVQ